MKWGLWSPEGCDEDFGFCSPCNGSQQGCELATDWWDFVVTGSLWIWRRSGEVGFDVVGMFECFPFYFQQ